MEPDPLDGVPEPPAGGAWPDPEPLPMFGQLCVEPEPELELPELLEPEPDELEEPELVLLDPVFEVLELDDGVVVEELVLALDPVVPVLDALVVAASATSALPVTRPVVSAPNANTLRNRTFMMVALSLCAAPTPFGEALTPCAPDLWPGAQQPQRAGCVS